ncbi:MAG TPA: SWIM zinc finger family protein [Micromonosporaceae bacterium]|nr:SWIM zinc finger family protein [Micromonosporaceae bacterium]
MNERFFGPSRPREVEGGLRARSSRGDIGETWWSRRFIDVLESFAIGGRLARGRNYARRGQVLSLDVEPGVVSAVVQGSRPEPYAVTVRLAPFPERVWAKVELILAEQAIHSAHLLAGEMPADLEDVFSAAGAPLFPRVLGDLEMRCSCPDWSVPCKHLAATFYLLAEAFDTDPFQILLWRGRPREALLARLRVLRTPDATDPVDDAAPGAAGPTTTAAGAMLALAELADPPVDPGRFWFSPVPLPGRPPRLPTAPGLLLRQLPAPGRLLGGTRLTDALAVAYARFADGEGG